MTTPVITSSVPTADTHSIVCRQGPTHWRKKAGAPQWMMGPSHDSRRSRRVVRITISPVCAETYTSVPRSSPSSNR